MSRYTIELRLLLQSPLFEIGLNDYPVPSFVTNATTWRKALNKKIIDHYYMDEICCGQPELFKHFINTKMREIMPYYCKLYEAQHSNFTFDSATEYSDVISVEESINRIGTSNNNRSNSTTTENHSSDSNYSIGVASDTPAQMLNVEDDIANNTYASSATKNRTTSTATDSSSVNGTNTEIGNTTENSSNTRTTTRTVSGMSGKTKSELYAKYVEALQNIDMLVVRDLESCFMLVY